MLKYKLDSSCVIMSLILMTTLFYKAMILQGEICCLGVKGLMNKNEMEICQFGITRCNRKIFMLSVVIEAFKKSVMFL